MNNSLVGGVGAFGATAMSNPASSPGLSAGIGVGTGLTGGFAQNLLPGPVGTSLGYLFQIVPGPMQSAIEKSKNCWRVRWPGMECVCEWRGWCDRHGDQ